jgi:hypothetical protein
VLTENSEDSMSSRKSMLLMVGACSALAFAAWSGGASSATSTVPSMLGRTAAHGVARHGWLPLAAKQEKLLYVSDYTASIVLIYQQGATGSGPIGEIVDGISSPQGVATDKLGTLYVANQGTNTITEYPAGATSPSVTLSTDISRPLDVSVDSKLNVYVTEGSTSTILEFKAGSTSPTVSVTLEHPSDATNSENRDLYVTHNVSSTGYVDRCKPLSKKCKDLGITVDFAQGIALDLKGNLLVGNYFGGVIDIYAPGQTTPFRTITMTNEEPAKMTLDTKDVTLYVADPANFAVRLFDYATGTQTTSFTYGSADELEGVALFPGQKPGE